MIATQNISLSYSGKPLFKNVNIKFTAGNCYGIIGANGTGKSTFLKVLSGELEPTTGEVVITPGERMAVLRQNHFEFDSYEVLQTVIMGHKRLYEIMKEKDELYAKEDFTDADGERASELEGEFAELDGWSAESNAETILTGLGISLDLEHKQMSELDGACTVRQPGHPAAGRTDELSGYPIRPLAGKLPAGFPEYGHRRQPRPSLPQQGLYAHLRHRLRQDPDVCRQLRLLV